MTALHFFFKKILKRYDPEFYDMGPTERGNKFAKELRATGSCMARSEKQRFAEHQVSCGNTGKSADDLRSEVGWYLAPRQAALRGIGQRDGRVEVRSRDWPERENQRD
jgi:hypothetical protein